MSDHPILFVLSRAALWTNEFIVALGAIAWPLVALLLAMRHHEVISNLLGRLREAPGTKFDPLPQQRAADESEDPLKGLAAGDSLATQPSIAGSPPTAIDPLIARLRSSEVMTAEDTVLDGVPGLGAPVHGAREQTLVTLAASLLVTNRFLWVEMSIWGSQLEMLAFLNSNAGAERDQLKTTFYDAAVERFPDGFRGYPFEGYLGFLTRHGLVVEESTRIRLTQFGREYLVWRVRQQFGPKQYG